MAPKAEYRFQSASALYLGERENQEDAVASDFALGGDLGFVVLSDGMGGHNAGDIASKVVVTEVFSELKLQSGDVQGFSANIRSILLEATETANRCVGDVSTGAPSARGMGATLIAPVFIKDKLFWLSIGDSPLYLFRNGHLLQLNEDHSMAPHIDLLVRSGMLTESSGRDHPDRNCLTSVLVGHTIARVDCPEVPTQLFDGDIIVVASDGLQHLRDCEIRDVLDRKKDDSSEDIAGALISEIKTLDAPEQDNVSLCVVKVAKHRNKSDWGYDQMEYSRDNFLAEGQDPATSGWVANIRSSIARLFIATNETTQ